jgi:hypothetical protein
MSSAARYFSRSPRYTFRPEDENLLRFAGMAKAAHSCRARVHDLSATGISFTVDPKEAPVTGAMLKIEFGLPGHQQVAWFAEVVRVELRSEWDPELGDRKLTLVALRFRKLPQPFAKAIQKSLGPRLENKKATNDDSFEIARDDAPPGYQNQFLFWTVTLAMLLSLTVMALPEKFWFLPFHHI